MIQEYSYRLKGSYKIIHCGQCDELDFKKFWRKMKDKSAGEMMAATIKTLKNQGVKTMTYDNGTENVNHSLAIPASTLSWPAAMATSGTWQPSTTRASPSR